MSLSPHTKTAQQDAKENNKLVKMNFFLDKKFKIVHYEPQTLQLSTDQRTICGIICPALQRITALERT
jgi:hypothetical protein